MKQKVYSINYIYYRLYENDIWVSNFGEDGTYFLEGNNKKEIEEIASETIKNFLINQKIIKIDEQIKIAICDISVIGDK